MSAHGYDLPQTKLPEAAILEIREAVEIRAQLRQVITAKYSNAALAKKWRVHHRTIEKVLAGLTHKGVL